MPLPAIRAIGPLLGTVVLLSAPAVATSSFAAGSDDLALVLEGTITQTPAAVVGPLAGAAIGDRFVARFVVDRNATQILPGWFAYPYVFTRGSVTVEDERAGFDSLSPLTSFWVSNDLAQIGDSLDAYVGLSRSDFDVQILVRDASGQMLDSSSLLDLVGPIQVPAAGNLAQIVLRDGSMDVTTVGQVFRAEVVELASQVGEGACVAVENSTGVSARIEAFGSSAVAANDLQLSCRRMPASTVALFLASRSSGYVVAPAGSRGNLCLGGEIGRLLPPAPTGPGGVASVDVDVMAIPQPTGAAAAFPGDTWAFQCWYRDSDAGTPTSNFSDSVVVRFD
ncbi:MAG: hypothetical protein AAGB93_16275 [Planctomycetota bacterium]